MNEQQPEVGPVVKVARDLRAIVELVGHLEDEAIHKANDQLMPGGLAMVALGGVASSRAYAEVLDEAEQVAIAAAYEAGIDPARMMPETYEDDEWEPPLQSLLFWSEAWRMEHGYPLPKRPTEATEANFLRWALDWAWDNEPHWDDFAGDVRTARARLENVLAEGRRAQRGVQCFDCQVDLIRPMRERRVIHACDGHDGVCTWPHRYCAHDRGGLADGWLCPSCDRRYDIEDYYRAVRQAHFAHADWLTIDEAAKRTNVSASTIKVWATEKRGHVRKRRHLDSGRMTYNVRDIERRLAGPDQVAHETTTV